MVLSYNNQTSMDLYHGDITQYFTVCDTQLFENVINDNKHIMYPAIWPYFGRTHQGTPANATIQYHPAKMQSMNLSRI